MIDKHLFHTFLRPKYVAFDIWWITSHPSTSIWQADQKSTKIKKNLTQRIKIMIRWLITIYMYRHRLGQTHAAQEVTALICGNWVRSLTCNSSKQGFYSEEHLSLGNASINMCVDVDLTWRRAYIGMCSNENQNISPNSYSQTPNFNISFRDFCDLLLIVTVLILLYSYRSMILLYTYIYKIREKEG